MEVMLMNIIICDDEKNTCAELEGIISRYASKYNLKLYIDIFFNGNTLIEYLYKEEVPDILFLDIEIPGNNGVAVGEYIRRVLENEQMFIVYISSKEQYAMQLFQNRPFDFLVKPLDMNKIVQVLDCIFRIMGKDNNSFEYQSNGALYRVQYKDIMYFQSIGKKISIVMKHEIRDFYGKLTDVEKKIPHDIFLNIHKSYLINFNYVKEYTYEWVKILNEDILNISKRNRAMVRRRIMEREFDEFRND